MTSFPFFSRQRGATVAGICGLALSSVLLLCGAGSVPVENFLPQGSMQADLNAGGHNVTNAATINATNSISAPTISSTNFTGSAAFANVTVSGTAAYQPLKGAPATAAKAASGSVFVAVGDSITLGTTAPLPGDSSLSWANLLASYRFFGGSGTTTFSNLGISGWKAADWAGSSGTQQASGVWSGGTYMTGTAHSSLAGAAAGKGYTTIFLGSNDIRGFTTACNTTNGSTGVTITGSTAGIVNGMQASGSGIVSGSTITISGTSVTLSQAATVTGTGASLKFFYPATTIENNLLALYTQAQTDIGTHGAIGSNGVIAFTVMDSGDFNSDQEAVRQAVNGWIRGTTAAAHYNYLVDADRLFPNASDPNWFIVSGGIGIHPAAPANRALAEYINRILQYGSLSVFDSGIFNQTLGAAPLSATGHNQSLGYYDFNGPWVSSTEAQVNIGGDGISSYAMLNLNNYLGAVQFNTPTGPSNALENNWSLEVASPSGGGSNNFTIKRFNPTNGAYVDTPLAIASGSGLVSLNDGATISGTATVSSLSSGLVKSASGVLSNGDLSGDVTTSGALSTTIAANAVSNAKLATMAANTVKMNNTGSTAVPTDVTTASAYAALFATIATGMGDLVYGGSSGAPTRLAANTSTTKKFLTETGTGSAGQAPAYFDLFGTSNFFGAAQYVFGGDPLNGGGYLGIQSNAQGGGLWFTGSGTTNEWSLNYQANVSSLRLLRNISGTMSPLWIVDNSTGRFYLTDVANLNNGPYDSGDSMTVGGSLGIWSRNPAGPHSEAHLDFGDVYLGTGFKYFSWRCRSDDAGELELDSYTSGTSNGASILVSSTGDVNVRTMTTANTTGTVAFNTSGYTETIYNTSGTTLASATITLPTTNTKGQVVTYTTHGAVTSVTMAGATVDVGPAVTSLAADSTVQWQAESANGHFVRIK